MPIGDSGYVFIAGSFQETVQFGNDVSLTSNGWIDTFIAKYDTSGNCIWAINMGGEYDDYCYSIVLDENGNIYGTGFFGRLADFDPSDEVANLSYHGPLPLFSDAFIANSPDGNYNWAMQTGSELDEVGFSLDVDDFGTIYLTGNFYGTCDFDPTEELMNVQSHGNADIFFAKYSQPTNFIHNENKLIPNKMVLLPAYPNPVNPTTTIRFNIPLESSASRLTSLQIFDIIGRVVKTLVDDFVQPGVHETQWDAFDQASGVYFVWLKSGTVVKTQKIVLVK
tara:strand:+ start:539 stop:1378 length:840 start_codon:yes stop_codon:yes gene_type:complete